MAESASATELHWFDPPVRAIIPLDEGFHIPRRLQRTLLKKPFTVKLDTQFTEVMRCCAAFREDRQTTWINREIISLYSALHYRGHAHSIEVWDGPQLVGGLYGVSLGHAFFGESMFSKKTDASKIALVHLVILLRASGFTLLDTQFQTEHLRQFGTYEVTRANYHHFLANALRKPGKLAAPLNPDWDHLVAAALQPVTQIS